MALNLVMDTVRLTGRVRVVSRTRLQRESGPAEHLAFAHLDVAGASFDRAGVPARGQALGDGAAPSLESFGE
jgi:hypothetical protein